MNGNPRKILIINVNWLGDVIFSTPAIRTIRQNFPEAHIACLVVRRCEEILRNNPRINELIVYDEQGKHRGIGGKLKFIRGLKEKKFDSVYILHPALKRAMIGWLAGIPERIGYATKHRGFLLTCAVPPPAGPMHKIDYFLEMQKKSGLRSGSRECEFFLSAREKEEAEEILRFAGIEKKDKFIVLNPGGNWLPKRWPIKNFAALLDLIGDSGKRKAVICGAERDRDLALSIDKLSVHKPYIIAGRTNLHQLAAVMLRADAVVTADSGPMHIGAAAGAKVIALFGPTSPRLTGPVGKTEASVLVEDVGCKVPCYDESCGDYRCMQAITPEKVFAEIESLLVEDDEHR